MRRTLVIAFALSLAATAGIAESDLEASLRAAEQGFAEAFARRDREAFAAFLHPDAVFMGPSGPLRGREAVLEVWGEMLTPPEAPFSWRPEKVMVGPSGDLGVTTGPVLAPDGEWVGAFASTWQRQPDGSWRVLFDMAPSCRPCQAPPLGDSTGGEETEIEAAAGAGSGES